MGDLETRIVDQFLEETGYQLPLTAEEVAVAAGLLLCPLWRGPAKLRAKIVFYDQSRERWEREVLNIACAFLLQRYDLPAKPEAWLRLAAAFAAANNAACS